MLLEVALAVALAAPARPTCPPPPRTLHASAFEALVRKGEPVHLHDVAVSGPVRIARARAPISCRRCSFDALVLSNAVVERVLDLRDLGSVRFLAADGAEFRQPLLLGVRSGCRIEHASFFLATFDDVADLDGTAFADASFRQARFRGPASLAHTSFAGEASFAGASFEQDARLDDARFALGGSFAAASFTGRAHFVRAQFGSPCTPDARGVAVDFTSATFATPADFGQAQFCGEVDFPRARFDGGATFLGAQFAVPHAPATVCDENSVPDVAASFDHTSSGARLDFASVLFTGTPQFIGVSTPSLSLEGAMFDNCVPLEMTDLSAIGDLRLAPADASRVDVPATRAQVLEAIEESAKSRKDLAVANDAHYRLLELRSESDGTVERWADHVFYRDVAGYFVRPFRPLLWLVILALLASLARALRPAARHEPSRGVRTRGLAPGPPRPHQRLERVASRFLTELSHTLSLRRRAPDDAPLARKVEGAIYAVLLVCFLLGLANSNPTLKQLVDALL